MFWVARAIACVPAIVVFALTVTAASGHALRENYVFLDVRETEIVGRFEVHESDLERAFGIELPEDKVAAKEAIEASRSRVQDHISASFRLGAGGDAYPLEFTDAGLLTTREGRFAQFGFLLPLRAGVPEVLEMHNTILSGVTRWHRSVVVLSANARTGAQYGEEHAVLVFGPDNADQKLDLRAEVPLVLSPRQMIWQGVLHIWYGIDHVLFLLALLLPTVLVLQDHRSWVPVAGFPNALWNVLKIVTVFTVAHSLTLSLAAFEIVEVPSRLVESIIALSIVLVAINNVFPKVREGSLLVILGLGLFHGLGFATVMGHLPFRLNELLKSVLGFNIGVELGQVAIVTVVFPLLYLLRRSRFYVPGILKAGSIALALVAAVWFVQRAFGLE